ncbi:MAG: B12-binding domain-containing radical SAM protein [bacterium]|nr:B12-binding domain-containing radical SAM protein [bacterium]
MKISLILPCAATGMDSQLDLKYLSKLFTKTGETGGTSIMGCIPSALPTLAALTPPDIDVSITDENIEKIDFDRDVDIVGISFLTLLSPRAYEIADEFRKRGVHVVLGGIHTTMFPEEALEHADTIFIGEAEDTWGTFINDFRAKKPEKKYEAEQRPDLQKLVIPRWNLMKHKYYTVYQVQTTRGCPFDCDFCAVRTFQGPPRSKPVEHVVREIQETLKYNKIPGWRYVQFADDNIISNKAFARKLFKALIPLNIRWSSQISINLAQDDELLDLAQKSGCDSVLIGFESISQQSLDSINKGSVNKKDFYKEAIQKIHDHGITIFGMFILGFDGEDESMFSELAQFVKETNIAFPVFNILTPIPGTRLYDRMQEKNRIVHDQWEKYNGSHVCFQPDSMSVEALQNGYYWLLKEVYSFEAIFKRLDYLWEMGFNKLDRNYTFLKLFLTVKLWLQKFKEQGTMVGFIERSILELRTKKGINFQALPMLLNFFHFAENLPETDFSPPGK